jgi:hypothetical protein
MMRILVAAVFSLMLAPAAFAIDNGQWNGVDPKVRDWFKSLRSPIGFPCCDFVDGARIEAPDYKENNDGSYEVFARGRWVHIPLDRVVKATNIIGYAVLWWGNGIDVPYCFMPGARG